MKSAAAEMLCRAELRDLQGFGPAVKDHTHVLALSSWVKVPQPTVLYR